MESSYLALNPMQNIVVIDCTHVSIRSHVESFAMWIKYSIDGFSKDNATFCKTCFVLLEVTIRNGCLSCQATIVFDLHLEWISTEFNVKTASQHTTRSNEWINVILGKIGPISFVLFTFESSRTPSIIYLKYYFATNIQNILKFP